ncbi:hypothetical protein CHUAL_007994 [Chamberlinius hualienensis]
MYSIKLIIIVYVLRFKVTSGNNPVDSCHQYAGEKNLIEALRACGTIARIDLTQPNVGYNENTYNIMKSRSATQMWMLVIDEDHNWNYNIMNLTSSYNEDRSRVIDASTSSGLSLSNINNYTNKYISSICYSCVNTSLPNCSSPRIMHEDRCYWLTNTNEDFDHSDMSCTLGHSILAPITKIQNHRILSILQDSTGNAGMWFGLRKNQNDYKWSNMTEANIIIYDGFEKETRRKRDAVFTWPWTWAWPTDSTTTPTTTRSTSTTHSTATTTTTSTAFTEHSTTTVTTPSTTDTTPSLNLATTLTTFNSATGITVISTSTASISSPQPPTILPPTNNMYLTNVSQSPSTSTEDSGNGSPESETNESDNGNLCVVNSKQSSYVWKKQQCQDTFIGVCMAFGSFILLFLPFVMIHTKVNYSIIDSPCKSTEYYYRGLCYSCPNLDGSCTGLEIVQINADDPLAKLYNSVCCLLGSICTGVYPQNMCGNNFHLLTR